jgi:hypothetical protein
MAYQLSEQENLELQCACCLRVCDKACSEMSSILPYKLYPRVVEDPDAGRRKVGVDDEQRRRQF